MRLVGTSGEEEGSFVLTLGEPLGVVGSESAAGVLAVAAAAAQEDGIAVI